MTNPFPHFSLRRRFLQLGRYGLQHPTKLFRRLNKTNVFLARSFDKVEITCNICGLNTRLWYEMLDTTQQAEHKVGLLRETLLCRNCRCKMRYRLMAHALLQECRDELGIHADSIAGLVGKIDKIDVLDTDATGDLGYRLRNRSSYRISSYMPQLPPGLLPDGSTFNIDLQAIGFPDKQFHVILSSDVMEHVRNLTAANKEIYRCLKPGGVHLFTVPFDEQAKTTRTLIDASSAADIYLEPPQVHGDSLTGGIVAYRVYAMDLLDALQSVGFEAKTYRVNASRNGIFEGRYFAARRPK